MAGIKNWDNELLDVYFQDIASSEPLSSEEEGELAREIRGGSREARNELVAANLRFVVRIASEYQGCGLPLEDLISAGNIGLITAAERFDETRGFKFITYAHWWVRQAIQNSLSQDSRMVRLPVNRIKLLNSITSLSERLEQEQAAEPESEAIARELGVSVDLVEDTLLRAPKICSLDVPFGEEDDLNPLYDLCDHIQELPDARVNETSDREQIEALLDTLEEREAEVLRFHFGLDGGEPATLEEIGNRLKLTKERVRQIKEKALSKLRHPRRRAYLDALREMV